jgi:hypothetical protein
MKREKCNANSAGKRLVTLKKKAYKTPPRTGTTKQKQNTKTKAITAYQITKASP